MPEVVFSPDLFVALAGLTFCIGYLIINQIWLRLVMMIGSSFYIVFYATVAEAPLWGAIWGSVAMIGCNIAGLAAIFARNAEWRVPAHLRDIRQRFDRLTAGDFLELMRMADRETFDTETVLGREGQPVRDLYYVINGSMEVEKRGMRFHLPSGVFVGETAYLLDRPVAATTVLAPGGEVIRWDVAGLRARAARKPRLALAVDAMISRDLAAKVTLAVSPDLLTAETA